MSRPIPWQTYESRLARWARLGPSPAIAWRTGLSGAGKTCSTGLALADDGPATDATTADEVANREFDDIATSQRAAAFEERSAPVSDRAVGGRDA